LVFDVCKRDTFNLVEKWIVELRSYTNDINLIIIGNKCDLPNHEVQIEEALELAKKYDSKYLPVSAYSGRNVNEIFSTLTMEIYHKKIKKSKSIVSKRKTIKVLEVNNKDNEDGGCGC
jgi:GTPase SAR1 family protein